MAQTNGRKHIHDSTPLAPAEIYQRSDEEYADMKPEPSARPGVKTKRAIISVLVSLNVILFILVITGPLFLAKDPRARLSSVNLKNFTHGYSPLPYFNAILDLLVEVENRNRGYFEFEGSTGSVTYDDGSVGEMKMDGGRAGRMGSTSANVSVEIRYEDKENSERLKDDVEYGIVVLKIQALLRGKVHLNKKVSKSARLKCSMYLDVKDQVLNHVKCR